VNKRPLKDISASIHKRLLHIARKIQRPFNELLQYYAMERLLHRLSRSRYAKSFVLKGALLFHVWNVPDSRTTRDIDLLAYTENSPENLTAIFCELCTIIDANDSVIFDPDTLKAQKIEKDADYEGVRIRFRCLLGQAQIPVHAKFTHGLPEVRPLFVGISFVT
jgi:hypothetical protein